MHMQIHFYFIACVGVTKPYAAQCMWSNQTTILHMRFFSFLLSIWTFFAQITQSCICMTWSVRSTYLIITIFKILYMSKCCLISLMFGWDCLLLAPEKRCKCVMYSVEIVLKFKFKKTTSHICWIISQQTVIHNNIEYQHVSLPKHVWFNQPNIVLVALFQTLVLNCNINIICYTL